MVGERTVAGRTPAPAPAPLGSTERRTGCAKRSQPPLTRHLPLVWPALGSLRRTASPQWWGARRRTTTERYRGPLHHVPCCGARRCPAQGRCPLSRAHPGGGWEPYPGPRQGALLFLWRPPHLHLLVLHPLTQPQHPDLPPPQPLALPKAAPRVVVARGRWVPRCWTAWQGTRTGCGTQTRLGAWGTGGTWARPRRPPPPSPHHDWSSAGRWRPRSCG